MQHFILNIDFSINGKQIVASIHTLIWMVKWFWVCNFFIQVLIWYSLRYIYAQIYDVLRCDQFKCPHSKPQFLNLIKYVCSVIRYTFYGSNSDEFGWFTFIIVSDSKKKENRTELNLNWLLLHSCDF